MTRLTWVTRQIQYETLVTRGVVRELSNMQNCQYPVSMSESVTLISARDASASENIKLLQPTNRSLSHQGVLRGFSFPLLLIRPNLCRQTRRPGLKVQPPPSAGSRLLSATKKPPWDTFVKATLHGTLFTGLQAC